LGFVLAFHRLLLTYYTSTLVLLLAIGCLLTALFLPLLERWHLSAGKRLDWARLLWAVLLLGFLVRLGGMLYPQFRSSDLLFHAHRLAWVMSGDLLFTADLPDVNIPAPYPPGLYVTLLPITPILSDLPLLLEIAGVVLHAGCGFLFYLLALRLTGQPALAFVAVLLQEVAPVTFKIYSWGNYTNLFSRAALIGVLVLLCLGRWREGKARGTVLLAGSFTLVLLGHFADSLLLVGLALVTMGLGFLTEEGRRLIPRILLAFLGAAALSALLYYLAPPIWGALLGGLDTFIQGEGHSPGLTNPIDQVFSFVQAPLVLLVVPGLLLFLGKHRRRRWPVVVLASAFLTACVFGLGQAAFGFSTRYTLFVLPVLALGTSVVLLCLWRRGWAGRVVVGVLMGYMLWVALLEWHKLIVFGQR
jgi:hypothetical protein